ncbi:hypothetical protein DFH06DRAFT_1303735 [Mycena polygramma]|nr:hypothetical protein DFH06DRAFT_1303735 [Mycena polygramma]
MSFFSRSLFKVLRNIMVGLHEASPRVVGSRTTWGRNAVIANRKPASPFSSDWNPSAHYSFVLIQDPSLRLPRIPVVEEAREPKPIPEPGCTLYSCTCSNHHILDVLVLFNGKSHGSPSDVCFIEIKMLARTLMLA